MLTGFALDRSKLTLNGRLRVAVLVLFAVAQAIGPADVYHRTTRHRLSDYTHFLHPPILLISATAALGAAVLWWAASAPDDSAGSARRSTAGAEGIPHR